MRTLHRSLLIRYAAVAVPARFADGGSAVALALLAVDRGDPALAGLLIAAVTVPHAAAGPFVGRLADRARSPRACYAAAMLLFAAALVGVGATLGRAPAVLPVLCALAAGTVGPLLAGGLSGLLAGLVPPGQADRANVVDATSYQLAGVAAPAGVAVLGGAVSPGWAIAGLAGVVAAGVGALLTLPVPAVAPDPAADRGVRGSVLGEVARAVWARPTLRATTVATTLGHLGEGGLTLAAVLLVEHLGRSAAAGGLLMSGYSLGALVGSLVVRRRLDSFRVVVGSLLAIGVLLGLAAFAPTFPVALALVCAAGFFDGPQLTATLAIRGRYAPGHLRAAVFTSTASLKISAGALGAALAGLLAGLGGQTLLVLVAASQPASALAGWLAGRSGTESHDQDRDEGGHHQAADHRDEALAGQFDHGHPGEPGHRHQ